MATSKKSASQPLVIGLDYGTDSVRALVVDARTGQELGTGVAAYKRWAAGKYCTPGAQIFRQHPQDYLDALVVAVKAALAAAGPGAAARVAGLGVDTTGSTPAPADASGRPLALSPAFAEDPDAMFVLWKDHSSVAMADRFNELAHGGQFTDYTKYIGGIYSSEWWWAKIAHITASNRKIAKAAHTWIEHCDWIPAELCGITDAAQVVRSRCAAGHKGCWHPSWGGYPDAKFLDALQPGLSAIAAKLPKDTATSDTAAGTLSPAWAKKLGLPAGIPVAVGAFDAHLGAVGAGAKSFQLAKVIGTSTCDMLMSPLDAVGDRTVRGICGQVDGSIMPGVLGLEAGQSAFGDIYAWYRRIFLWPFTGDAKALAKLEARILPELEKAAAELEPGAGGLTVLDWHNGRRTPDANQRLRGAIAGIHLGTDAPALYRGLIESTACGARAIAERFVAEGVPVKSVIALGGIARRSPLVMQILADVMGRPIAVVASDQCCALGSAVAAATAAKIYPSMAAAQKAIASPIATTYKPHAGRVKAYEAVYARYLALGQHVVASTTA